MGSSGLAFPGGVAIFVNMEAVDANAFDVLELSSNQGVISVGAGSFVGKVCPSPDVRAIGWLEPDLSAKVFLWLFDNFSLGVIGISFGVGGREWVVGGVARVGSTFGWEA